MTLIKPDLERVDGSKNKEIFTDLIANNFTGFVVTLYHDNGQILFEREWKNGRAYGYEVEYYDNGQTKYYHQKNDYQFLGPSMAFWEDGSVRHEETDDYTRQYDRNGNITYEVGNGAVKGKAEDYTL